MPSQSKPRAPQTPAPGSSPIRPPSGSARKTPTAQRRSAPARPNLPTPPVNPPSPAVQRMMQRKLQQLAAQQQPPAIRPPGLAAPAQQQRPAPPPMQSRPGPTPITPSQPQSTFSQATTSPWGAGLMNGPAPDDGTQTGFARDIAYPVVKRLAQAWDTVTAPTYQETPAPTMQDLGATGVAGAGSPAVRGIRQNEDGSEDWVIAGAAGQNDYTPKTRTVAPNPLQMLSRSVTQGAMMGLEAWGVPAKIVERGLGTVTANTAQLTKPVNLPDGTVYTPPTRDTATPSTVQLGAATGPRYVFPDNTLAATARNLFGNTPAVQTALNDVTAIAYSPPESQLRAVARIVEYGQLPDLALYGDAGYVNDKLVALGYLDDPVKAIKADPLANYVYTAWKADGFTDEQIVEAFNEQGLPGEQYLPTELTGQLVLDPLNAVGSFTKPWLESQQVARATKWFATQTTRTVDNIVAGLARGMTPSRVGVLDAVIGRTPTAVRSELVTYGSDAIGALLTQVRQAPKGGASPFMVLKAFVESVAPAPERALYAGDEAFELARAAWQAGQDSARQVLGNFSVATSDAGKLGAALTRQMLLDDNGQVSGKALKALIENADNKPVHELITAFADKLDNAAEALLTPARQGAESVAQFVERTGLPAQQYPIFEKGLAGAQERVRVAKAATAAGLDYKVNPLATLADGFMSFRNTVNSGLWKLFAEVSPAYSARNALNNLVTALADGNMTFTGSRQVDDFLQLIGSPQGAFKGLGAGAAESTKAVGGFAGNLRTTNIPGVGGALKRLGVDVPLGAAAIEEVFSKRIVYTAARRYLDRVMVLGKAIPNLPPSVSAALGEDMARGLVQQIASTYGDVDGALAWLNKRGQSVDLWRVMDSEFDSALAEFSPAVRKQVMDALNSAQTQDEARAAFAQIRKDIQAQLKLADDAMPDAHAMVSAVADNYAEGIKAANASGVDVARVMGRDPAEFSKRLTALRNSVDTARGVANLAVQRGGTPEGVQAFMEADLRLSASSQAVEAETLKLLDETRKQELAIRSMKITPSAKGHMLDDLWRKYFSETDRLWTANFNEKVQAWNEVSRVLGVEMTAVGDEVAQAAPVVGRTGNAKVDFQNEMEWLKTKRDQFAAGTPDFAQWQIRINELDADPKAYFKQRGYQDVPYVRTPTLAPTTAAKYGSDESGLRSALAYGSEIKIQGDPKRYGHYPTALYGGQKETFYFPGGGQNSSSIVDISLIDEVYDNTGQLLYSKSGVPAAQVPSAQTLPITPSLPPAPANVIPSKWTPADPRSILATLGSLERDVLGKWGQTRPVNMTPEVWALVQDWAQAARQQMGEARTIAGQVGSEARNFALLNYGDRRNFDMALGVTHPYHYWYGRTQANWLKRAALNPAMMANYGRYRTALNDMHAALPEYWRQQLSTDDLGLDMDTPLMFNLEQTLSPLYGMLGSDFSIPERRTAAGGLGAYAEDAGAIGPTLWAPFGWGLALTSFLNGDTEGGNAWLNNYLGSVPRAVRAVTALAGVGGPGGVNLDPQMLIAGVLSKKGLKLNGMTTWERNRVAQLLTGYLENVPAGTDKADWQAQLAEAAYTQQGPLWDKAMQEMFANTAPSVLVSYAVGLGFKGRAEYEKEFSDIYREVASLRANYANMEPEEIQQAYLDLERRHPMYDLLMLSRANGPERNDAWVWEAMGRVGIGDREAWAAAGVSEAALDAFFNTKTTEGMDRGLLDELLSGANTINARNRPRSIDESQRQLDAQQANNAIKAQLHTQFAGTGAFELEQAYFEVRDAQGPEAAKAWLAALPANEQGLIYGLWDARSEAQMAAGPEVQSYFLDAERYEQLLVGQHYDEMDAQYPGARELAADYKALQASGDYDAARLLKEEHPELQAYWDANGEFFDNELRPAVLAWLKTLPANTQGEARADFDPEGLAQDNLTTYYQGEAAARQGAYDSRYTDDQATGGATAPTSTQEQYRLKAEQARLDAEGRQDYLTTENKLAYSDAFIKPFVDSVGAVAAADYLDAPIAQQWPSTTGGVAALVKMVGEAGSVREGLMAYATKTKSADWAWYVGLLRNMDDAALQSLARRYPQLADAALVAEQARAYDYPTLNGLHDILGFNISISESGIVSFSRQTVKTDKKTGSHKLTIDGNAQGSSGGSGGFSGGSVSAGAYRRLSGRSGGSGGGGGGGAATDAPDPDADGLGGWIAFAAQIKLEQPEALTWLMDFFDAPNEYARNVLLQRYPGLMALLQQIGAEKLAALSDGYYLWREDQAAAQSKTAGGKKSSPQIIRYYRQRPSASGLN